MKAAKAVRQMLVERGFEVEFYDLWDLNIEHCNGCYGTEDYWCHYPCTCWPFDDMHYIYRGILKADAIVICSPVNEAQPASRFKEMWDRCISLDGGLEFAPPPGWKKDEQQLEQMRGVLDEEGQRVARAVEARRQVNTVLAEMQRILTNMLELQKFNDVLANLRRIIKDHKRISELTAQERERLLKELKDKLKRGLLD